MDQDMVYLGESPRVLGEKKYIFCSVSYMLIRSYWLYHSYLILYNLLIFHVIVLTVAESRMLISSAIIMDWSIALFGSQFLLHVF